MDLIENNYSDFNNDIFINFLLSNNNKEYKLDIISRYINNHEININLSYINLIRIYLYLYQSNTIDKKILDNILTSNIYDVNFKIMIQFIILLCFINNIIVFTNKT